MSGEVEVMDTQAAARCGDGNTPSQEAHDAEVLLRTGQYADAAAAARSLLPHLDNVVQRDAATEIYSIIVQADFFMGRCVCACSIFLLLVAAQGLWQFFGDALS